MSRPMFMRTFAALLFSVLACAAQATPEQEAANKAAVLAFYEKGLNQKDADAALKYVGDRYVQHNPNAADGPEGLRQFIAFLRDKYPASHSEIKRVFTDGDYVFLHVHAVREPGTRGNAIIDIFRLEGGKIVEHWDAVQPIPEKAANSNGMF
ncbi:nuclear transport factor 2 family protein [Achromobacter animicus]|uniref:nuclear transport factor 2 family protein n=1 Tax=Achromobacter animicus TaxID=1389935 RepID=UPI00244C78FE|nr:nuclear transport factor 2 family protein [Achromobacter animicus]MDH0684894.1 nuclear transport factor 2 family protein [Achromobacter animicus]